jgi:hypothetical protein
VNKKEVLKAMTSANDSQLALPGCESSETAIGPSVEKLDPKSLSANPIEIHQALIRHTSEEMIRATNSEMDRVSQHFASRMYDSNKNIAAIVSEFSNPSKELTEEEKAILQLEVNLLLQGQG